MVKQHIETGTTPHSTNSKWKQNHATAQSQPPYGAGASHGMNANGANDMQTVPPSYAPPQSHGAPDQAFGGGFRPELANDYGASRGAGGFAPVRILVLSVDITLTFPSIYYSRLDHRLQMEKVSVRIQRFTNNFLYNTCARSYHLLQ